jgi:hypothetical protein
VVSAESPLAVLQTCLPICIVNLCQLRLVTLLALRMRLAGASHELLIRQLCLLSPPLDRLMSGLCNRIRVQAEQCGLQRRV